MKQIYLLLFFLFSFNIYSQVQVRGYYRKNGTYVQPHTRSAPNSTITDNYSYQRNYNYTPQYSTPKSKKTYNYSSGNSTSNAGSEWIHGYYRSDGTYVNGYYRKKRKSSSNSYSNNRETYSHDTSLNTKYVNTTKVNFRTSPITDDNIIGKLEYGDMVTSIEKDGYWEKVSVKRFDSNSGNYTSYVGFINSRYLSDINENTSNTFTDYSSSNSSKKSSKTYMVISSKAYFHSIPDIKNKKKAYLVYGESVISIAESKYFIYTEFTNLQDVKTTGWILKDDLAEN